jgi:uncharacterized LabA/DUF88 family protein
MSDQTRIALLVDAENVNVEQTRFALEDAGRRGLLTIRRAFGDFFRPHLAAWKPFLTEEAFSVELSLSAVARKDTADLLLGQYAVRIAERGLVDMIALVSSDSDFGAIARSVSESGVPAIGYGRRDVPEAWRRSCAEYIAFPEAKPKPAADLDLDRDAVRSTLLNLLRDAADPEGWLRLNTLGARLANSAGKGYAKRAGAASLTKLVQRFDKDIEIERRAEQDGATPAVFVRRRKR